ncbi:USP2 [Cordylochernes scorpioides]|uniref:ubiquitinyl hydrolase 1 n=1 Tax=Cordylochernes scorpioides TaxID=51811 RepID=A0ABY6KXY1_9ARAC|nr:USP2 [Cordylochernes scorpioides]
MPGHRKRRQFKQTDAFTRGMVIGLKREGWSIRQIAADTHLGASTVHRLWRRWLEQGNVAIYRNASATRVTSARVDRRILRQAVAAPQATCTAILQHVQDTLDHSISTRTISRRLVANGLHSCRPLRRLPLTPPNRRQRLEWCRARSTWMTEWHRVVFSDESRFCLSSDSRRVRVWRRRGERSNPAAIVTLLRIQGTMTAQRYVDDVLRPVTLPYLQGVPNALYQQDNARLHTARISQQALQDVQMLPWPPYSPDLSPIEHVWDIIGRHVLLRASPSAVVLLASKPTPSGIDLFNVRSQVIEGAPSLKDHAVGLYNLGNTCYSNAIVQSLAHTTAVLENCLWNFKPENINPDSISGGQIIKRFGNLLSALWKEESSFRPIEFHKQVGMFESKFGDYSEQDSMEFLQFLLEHLHNDLHQPPEPEPCGDTIDEGSRFWRDYRATENSLIVVMFAGQTVNATHCQSCPRISQNFEAFWHLSLPIPEKKGISLLDCFDKFFEKEVINDYICPDCSKKGSVRTINVLNWPNILIAQLIRFPDFGGGKNNKMVDIPPILDLTQFGSDAKYKLYAIVNHYGTPHTGHFTSVCKHPTSGEWFTMDDHRVKNTNSNKVIRKNAYILFYERMK